MNAPTARRKGLEFCACAARPGRVDIFWLKDHALDDPDLLPSLDEAAAEIVESLETALERFRNVAKALGEKLA